MPIRDRRSGSKTCSARTSSRSPHLNSPTSHCTTLLTCVSSGRAQRRTQRSPLLPIRCYEEDPLHYRVDSFTSRKAGHADVDQCHFASAVGSLNETPCRRVFEIGR